MDNQVYISNIEIISGKKTKILNKREIRQFCKEKVQLSMTLALNDVQYTSNSGEVSNTIDPKYVPNDLLTKTAQKDQKYKFESMVRCFKMCVLITLFTVMQYM